MLLSARFEDFKSFQDATLPLAELTLLIGANASGKSNALEGLKLLSWIANNGRLSNIHFAMKDRDLRVRGTTSTLPRNRSGGDDLHLGCRLQGPPELGVLELRLGLRRTADGLRIIDETLTAPDLIAAGKTRMPLYTVASAATEHGSQLEVEYNNFSRGKNKPRITCVDQQAAFVQLVSPARYGANHTESQRLLPLATQLLQDRLSAVLFLDPSPASMRSYSYTADKRMQGDGANVSAVLFDLCEQGRKPELLDFIRSLPEQNIRDLRFARTGREEVVVELVETFGGEDQVCDAGLLSDGTLRVLAIAAALESVPEGTLVIIEEIDNGVHPSRAAMLLERIQNAATRRSLRVLLTTHNPALLDALPDRALGDVTLCYRDAGTGNSELLRLGDLDTLPSLMARGPLGQLVTRGILDRHVKARETGDARVQRGLRWLDGLEAGPQP